jgi:hypothetical protein
MKLALTLFAAILGLIRWLATAQVTMTAGHTQITMPVFALVVTLAASLALAAGAGLFAMVWQEAHHA